MTQSVSEQVTTALMQGFFSAYPDEAARLMDELPADEAVQLLGAAPAPHAAAVFARLNPDGAAQAVEQMDDEVFRRVFAELNPSRGALLLARLAPEVLTQRLAVLPAPLAKELREFMTYPPGTAGHLMDPRVTALRPGHTAEEALDSIRRLGERRILDLCLVDEAGVLQGVVSLQAVAGAQLSERLGDLVKGRPVCVQAIAPKEDVVALLEHQKLTSLPVVDFEGKLLGIIRHDALVAAVQQDASEDIQAMVGAGRDERALSGVWFVVQKRLPWLQINLGTAFLAAFVVALFEDTIARFTALAVLLPVVAGQSGNTGAQALAVTMRGLALREIRMRAWARVARKEALAGFLNGCTVGLTTALFVYVFMDSFGLAVVIGVSMVFSMVCAGLAGATIPVILTGLGQDPAQSASIILTTVTDVMGFLSFLGLATLLATAFNLAL